MSENKWQISDNSIERFVGVVQSIVEPMGIDKIPEVMHYVELLVEAANRKIFDGAHPSSATYRIQVERKKFITIFKQRYLQLTDIEYIKAPSPIEAKLIGQVSKQLEDNGFKVEEFLQWAFEVFLAENPRFCPPMMKVLCSSFVVEKFMYDNKEVVKQRRDAEIRKKESLDLINRARNLKGMGEANGDNEIVEKVVTMLKNYRDQVSNVVTFRQMLEQAEKTYKKAEQAEGGTNGIGCGTGSGECSESV